MGDSLHAHAQACVAAGLCALPAVRNGQEKRPALSEWKPYQSRLPSREELARWFDGSATALCLVCGAVSGNLEMIDFDLGGEAFEPWRRAVESMAPGLVDRLVIESTPSGGRHVIYRCDQPISGNTKLAQRRIEVGADEPVVVGCKEHKPRRDSGGAWVITITMIETRGEGGLFLCAPSDGYGILHGELAAPPVITSDERDILLGCAWALDETRPLDIDTPSAVSDDAVTSRPGDDFNRRGDPRAVLLSHGWTLVQRGENEHWCRPGKSAGTSATLKDGVFYVFSTNAAPFEAQQGYSPFAVYALLEHGGDFTAAASALASQGYGSAPTQTRGVDLAAFVADVPPAPDNLLAPAPLSVEQLVSGHPLLRPPVVHGLLRQGETMNVIASPKVGKALAIDTPILTQDGWVAMGDLQPGMHVHAGDGSLTRIVAVSGIMHDRPCYRVRTKSGASLIADAEHLWSVCSRNSLAVVPTHRLSQGMNGRRWKLPIAAALQRPRTELPIDPWMLGYWLGNGTTTSGEVTVAEPDVRYVQDHLTRAGFAWGRVRQKRGAATFTVLGLQPRLRAIGVLSNKHVPQPYLLAAEWQRRVLLAGLLDSDGHAGTRSNGCGLVEFCSTSAALADAVAFLARSLGHKPYLQVGRARLNGRDYGAKYRISFAATASTCPFSSPRKSARLPHRRLARRSVIDAVASVERVASVPVQCIQVEHPSGTFLAGRDLTVTHNSWLTLDLAIAVATGRPWLGRYATERGDVLIIDNELHRETSAHRIPKVAHARGIPMREFNRRIFVDNIRGRLRDIFTLAPYFAAIEPGRYKVIVLDAFYRFMPAGGDENDNGTMANIYNCIDAFADRLGCSFVLIHHSSKGNQTGKSVTDVGAGAGAQSRATDTHVVLRPHEEDHVVVLEAAVRSWPPVEPLCLRWEFPVWTADETLDSSQLLSQGGRSRSEPGKKDEWTPESFVEAFVDDEPATRSAIIGRAVRDGLSKWAADNLLRMADADGLLARNGDGKRNDPFTYQRLAKAPSTPEDRP
ncbi:MAG: AAA family ATPase [Phycisphaerales bacterium]|nr:AAA family ATPase [Phycisphaerales bacterium]